MNIERIGANWSDTRRVSAKKDLGDKGKKRKRKRKRKEKKRKVRTKETKRQDLVQKRKATGSDIQEKIQRIKGWED